MAERNIAGGFAMMALMESLKAGKSIEIPSLGITLTAKDLVDHLTPPAARQDDADDERRLAEIRTRLNENEPDTWRDPLHNEYFADVPWRLARVAALQARVARVETTGRAFIAAWAEFSRVCLNEPTQLEFDLAHQREQDAKAAFIAALAPAASPDAPPREGANDA